METSQRQRTLPEIEIPVMSREQFLRTFGEEYQQGQHVTLLGPTQRGKTTICHQMLDRVISPKHKAVILAAKPPGRDGNMETVSNKLNLRKTETWPPGPYAQYRNRKENGYLLQPHQTMTDHEKDEANLHEHFKRALNDNYASDPKHPVISVVDEGHYIQNDLKLKKEIEAPFMRGAPVNAEWILIQRGRFMTYHAYGAPEHVLIAHDPDRDNQKRYGDIGGVDPRLVTAIVAGLKTKTVQTAPGRKGTISEFLWIQRSGNRLVIVDMV